MAYSAKSEAAARCRVGHVGQKRLSMLWRGSHLPPRCRP